MIDYIFKNLQSSEISASELYLILIAISLVTCSLVLLKIFMPSKSNNPSLPNDDSFGFAWHSGYNLHFFLIVFCLTALNSNLENRADKFKKLINENNKLIVKYESGLIKNLDYKLAIKPKSHKTASSINEMLLAKTGFPLSYYITILMIFIAAGYIVFLSLTVEINVPTIVSMRFPWHSTPNLIILFLLTANMMFLAPKIDNETKTVKQFIITKELVTRYEKNKKRGVIPWENWKNNEFEEFEKRLLIKM